MGLDKWRIFWATMMVISGQHVHKPFLDGLDTNTHAMFSSNHLSIPLGIIIGLIASFVQSLGLTIQRKSHVLNQSLPDHQQRVEHRRPSVFFIFMYISLKCSLTLTDFGCSVLSYSSHQTFSGLLSKSPLSRSSSLHHWVPYHCCGMPSSPVCFLAMSSLRG